MRVLTLLALSMCVAVALAGEADTEADVAVAGEADADNELEVPTLPGLDSGCLPTYSKRNFRSRSWKRQGRRIVAFGGKCVTDAACPAEQAEPGYCAGIGVTCCKGVFAAAPTYMTRRERRAAGRAAVAAAAVAGSAAAPIAAPVAGAAAVPAAAPVLRAGATPCSSQGGTCMDDKQCTGGTVKSGLCPNLPNNIRCCFRGTTPPTPTGVPMSALIPIPAGINRGTTRAGASVLNAKLGGTPGCPLTAACFSCTCSVQNALIKRNTVTLQITPTIRLTGIKPFVDAIKRGLDRLKADGARDPQKLKAYNELKTAGGLCCRAIKKANGQPGSSWSNHSWGCAVDFYYGSSIDPRGDGKTQAGLAVLAPYFNAEKLYWAAGYSGASEDAMHFEASVESLNAWIAGGLK